MQQAAFDACLRGDHTVLLSPTGSGKTLAYLLPLISRIDVDSSQVQAVVIVPSRELAQQSAAALARLKTPVRSVCCHGGRPAMTEHRTLREVKPHLVFSTPGRLNDHLTKENILGGTVTTLVIDEFDKSLELGFHDEMAQIARRLPFVRQCVLTSATDAPEIPAFIRQFTTKGGAASTRLDYLSEGDKLQARQRYFIVDSPRKDKLETLGRLLSSLEDGQAVVFVLHRESAERIGHYLRTNGFSQEVYHGGMEQDARERALSKFRSGCSNILVATDLAARGLDIADIRAVVHYNPAPSAEAFTHRNGRTARWDASGSIYVIRHADEPLADFVPRDAEHLDVETVSLAPRQPRWTAVYIGRGRKDKLSKMDIVGFFCKKGGLRSEDIGSIELSAHFACVAIARSKVKAVLQAVTGEKIKGMKTLIELMRR